MIWLGLIGGGTNERTQSIEEEREKVERDVSVVWSAKVEWCGLCGVERRELSVSVFTFLSFGVLLQSFVFYGVAEQTFLTSFHSLHFYLLGQISS